MRKKPQRTRVTLLDKLVDQTLTLALSFLVSTALLGGSAYLLFQLPSERNALDRAILQFQNFSKEVAKSPFWNDIVGIFKSEWDSDVSRERRNRMSSILGEVSWAAARGGQLEPNFVTESLVWIPTTRVQYESAKRRIGGFVLTHEIEKAFQRTLVEECDAKISALNEMQDMIMSWGSGGSPERARRMAVLEQLSRESVGRLSGLVSTISQLEVPIASVGLQAAQTASELQSQIQIIKRKMFLSIIGTILGTLALGFLGFAVYKRIS